MHQTVGIRREHSDPIGCLPFGAYGGVRRYQD